VSSESHKGPKATGGSLVSGVRMNAAAADPKAYGNHSETDPCRDGEPSDKFTAKIVSELLHDASANTVKDHHHSKSKA
jgi:hypothetical protein